MQLMSISRKPEIRYAGCHRYSGQNPSRSLYCNKITLIQIQKKSQTWIPGKNIPVIDKEEPYYIYSR